MDSISKTPYYKKWLAEQESLDLFREQEEKRASILAHQKWEYLETLAQERWARQQKLLLEEEVKRKEQEALIKKEWEKEQEKDRLEKEAKEKEEKKKRLQYERIMEEMESFIDGTGAKPVALNTSTESNPGKEPCQFFSKVGACRFKDSCSRNHIRPAISHIILLPGFYTHLSLDVGTQGEYDTDINLEFDHNERYRDFEEFFDDITPELEKYGRISQIRVCSNTEPHLRGNVYVAYQSERSAAAAYKALNGRYYASRMISVEFVNLLSWKAAACGLQFRGKCPKGSKCNFLHVFKNPRGKYSFYETPAHSSKRLSTTPDRDWRWTPSPEREPSGERTSNRRQDDWECDSRDENGKTDRRNSSRRSARSRSKERQSERSRLSERRSAHAHPQGSSSERRSAHARPQGSSSERRSRKSDSERKIGPRDRSRSGSRSERSRMRDSSRHRKESSRTKRSKV